MRLIRIWLKENERSMSWFARHCNVSPAAVKYWLDERHTPSRKHKMMITEITGIEI